MHIIISWPKIKFLQGIAAIIKRRALYANKLHENDNNKLQCSGKKVKYPNI